MRTTSTLARNDKEGKGELRVLHDGRFIDLVSLDGWEFARRKKAHGVVSVLPLTKEGNIILVEQFRSPLCRRVLEFPAGLVGDTKEDREHQGDEAERKAAARELEEETGYRARRLHFVRRSPTSPGLTDEVVTIFLATRLEKVGDGGGVAGEEDIIVHTVALDEVDTFLRECEEADVMIGGRVEAGIRMLERFVHHRKEADKK